MKAKQQYLIDLAERAFFTFVEAFLAAMLLGNALDLNVNTLEKAGLAGLAAGLAVVKGGIAGFIGEKGTAAALPEPDNTIANGEGP